MTAIPKLDHTPVPQLKESFETLRETIKEAFSQLIFRRVEIVFATAFTDVRYYTTDKVWRHYNPDAEPYFDQYHVHNIEYHSDHFYGFTSTQIIRENDNLYKHAIQFDAKNYAELDIINGTFEFIPIRRTVAPRNDGNWNKNNQYSENQDLLCGVPEMRYVDGKPAYYFSKWFVCSEQFLRMWTAVMYYDHKTFQVAPGFKSYSNRRGAERAVFRWLMTGNRLCVNNFQKWVISAGIENVETHEETLHRYYRLRTETLCRAWVHTYCAIVLMCRYNQLPTTSNLPQNLPHPTKETQKDVLHMPYWDLPPFFCERLLGLIDEDDSS
jgi:hypothetical protein